MSPSSCKNEAKKTRTSTGLRWLLPILLLVFGSLGLRSVASNLYLSRSQQSRHIGDVAAARSWLTMSRNWGLPDAKLELERAALARVSGDWSAWSQHIEKAEKLGSAVSSIDREQTLFRLAQAQDEDLSRIAEIVGAQNISIAEVFHTILPGVLAKDNYQLAEQLLAQWREQLPNDPNLSYWTALTAEFQGDSAHVKEALLRTLELSPHHQSAQLALAKVEMTEDKLQSAKVRYRQLWQRDGLDEAAVGLAEVYRRSGQYESAIQLLDSIESPKSQFEFGHLAMETGDYESSIDQLKGVSSEDGKTALAIALHLAHRDQEATQLLNQVAEEKQREHARKESLGRQDSQ